MIIESNETTHKTENSWCQAFWVRLVSWLATFGQLALIGDPHKSSNNQGMDSMITKDQTLWDHYFILMYKEL